MQSRRDQEPFDFICAKKFGYLGLCERKSSEGKGKIGKKKKKRGGREGRQTGGVQRASCLLQAQGTDRVKLTTVSPGSQKCLFNKQRGKLILHMTHLQELSIFQELLVN